MKSISAVGAGCGRARGVFMKLLLGWAMLENLLCEGFDFSSAGTARGIFTNTLAHGQAFGKGKRGG